jgi:DNA-binding MarR family transcriptional regulator
MREKRLNPRMPRDHWRSLGARHWPGIFEKAAVLSWKFMVIAERVHAALDPEVLRYGIQPGDFEVLVTLRIHGAPYELSPTAIYRARCLSSGGLTKILHRLKQARLIARHPDPRDRRSQLVRLSSKGKRVVEAAMDEMGRLERQMLAPLAKADHRRLSGLLDMLMNTLEPVRPVRRAPGARKR